MVERKDRIESGEIFLEKGRELHSLVKGIQALPLGVHYFSYADGALIPCQKPTMDELDRGEMGLIGITRRAKQITIENAGAVEYPNANNPRMSIELLSKRRSVRVHYLDGMRADPSLSASFKLYPDCSETALAGATLRIPIIPDCFSLYPEYAGDDRALKFVGLKGLTQEQVEMLFRKDVPDIDNIFPYMLSRLSEKGTRVRISAPELTFNPRRRDYLPLLGNAYLLQDERSEPILEPGAIIRGVFIVNRTGIPYEITVRISETKQVTFLYGNGRGKATRVSGTVSINGKEADATYLVYNDKKNVITKPELLLVGAFVAVAKVDRTIIH
jgi:hypothetical protein